MKLPINFILLLVMGLSWGLHFALIKMAACNCSPFFLLFPTFAGISLLFLLLCKLQGKSLKWNFSIFKFFTIAGVLGYLFPILVELIAAPKMDAGLLTLIVTMTPLMTIFITGVFRIEKIYAPQILASIVGSIAVFLLFIPLDVLSSDPFHAWAIFAFLVPLSYAIYNIYVAKYWPSGLSSLQAAAGESVASAIFAFPLFLMDVSPDQLSIAYTHSYTLIGLILATAIEVWAFFELIRRTGPIYVSFASFTTLLSGFFWGWLLFNEQLTFQMVCSSVLVLLSFVILNLKKEHFFKR